MKDLEPTLYLRYYFNEDFQSYYQLLNGMRLTGDWSDAVFLSACYFRNWSRTSIQPTQKGARLNGGALGRSKQKDQPITGGMQMIFEKHQAAILAMATAVVLLFAHSGTLAETKQERVHRMSHRVMPFDMSKTIHVFRMTESGGVQKVLARDPSETDQILLIRQHLSHEAAKFRRGDYADPTKLHGEKMPGLAELRANPLKVKVSYSELPAGAQITFETKNLRMLTAIHRWFGAQLSEHGADAKAE